MRYRYLDDFRRGISVFAIFSYGIAVLGTPQCAPHSWYVYATESADRSDKRDERGELEIAIYGHILPPCPLLYFEKKKLR